MAIDRRYGLGSSDSDRPLNLGQRKQQGEGFAIAADVEDFDCREFFVFRPFGVEHRRGARLAHQLGDGCIGFLRESGIDQLDRIRIGALKCGIGRRAARARIGAHEGECAKRGSNRPTQTIGDPDLLDRTRGDFVDNLAGQRVNQPVIGADFFCNEHHAVGFTDIGQTILERLEHRHRSRVARRRDRADLRLGFLVAAVGKTVDELTEIGRVRR